MFSKEGLLQFHTWTNYSLDRLFKHCAQFSTEELTRELDGFGFPSLWDQLAHIVMCEDWWLGKVTDDSSVVKRPVERTYAYLMELKPVVNERTRAYLRNVDDATLNAEITITFEDCDAVETATPAYYLHHVLTHAFHHKGQVAAICRLLGKPFTQDMDLLYTANWAESGS